MVQNFNTNAETLMPKSLPPILGCLVAGVAAAQRAFSWAEPLHYRLASDPTVPGKSKEGQCMDYAIALSSRLASRGIHGELSISKKGTLQPAAIVRVREERYRYGW